MFGHADPGRGKRSATLAVLLAVTAAILLGLCTPASALRPRTTPGHAAALVATRGAAMDAAAAARHDATISRMTARHRAAQTGSAAVSLWVARDRLHRPTALTPRGALAVATFAAITAIILVSVAVVIGSRRQEALRRRAEAKTPPAVLTRHQIAG